jgi:pyrimidine-specific ribonucleoside hydrolase
MTVAACAPLTNVTDYVSPYGAHQIVLIGELVVEDEPECNVGNDPGAAVAVFKADLPTVEPVDLFEGVVVPAVTGPSAAGIARDCGSPRR